MNIIVIGDVMIDVYIDGVVNRISPEAPVPVFLEKTRKAFPGGAANVARNIASLGGACCIVGGIGQDSYGVGLNGLLKDTSILHYLLAMGDRPTTRKTRYIAQGQQIMRVDDETTAEINDDAEAAVVGMVDQLMESCKVLVISDYGKGLLTRNVLRSVIIMAANKKIPIIVDPKSKDFSRYSGATILKPNAEELSRATGMPTTNKEECLAAASVVMDFLPIKHMLITRADKGMLLIGRGMEFLEVPATSRDVYDVTGAGDTALAALAVCLAEGKTLHRSVSMANIAAGIAVTKHGTTSVTRKEVDDAFVRT